MGLGEIISFLALVFKLALVIFDKLQKTPSEKRRDELAAFDQALEKAKVTKDPSDLSKWLGGKL